jgi:hypothetical protein
MTRILRIVETQLRTLHGGLAEQKSMALAGAVSSALSSSSRITPGSSMGDYNLEPPDTLTVTVTSIPPA